MRVLPQTIAKRDALWDYLKTTNPAAYKTISLQKLGLPLQFKTKFGKSIDCKRIPSV